MEKHRGALQFWLVVLCALCLLALSTGALAATTVEVDSASGFASAVKRADAIVVKASFTFNEPITINRKIEIYGKNEASISRGTKDAVLFLSEGAQVKLHDLALDGQSIESDEALVQVLDGATFRMSKNALITSVCGGGVLVEGGEFVMDDSTASIRQCTSEDSGAGVYVNYGSFVFKGGALVKNHVYDEDNPNPRGGGVCVASDGLLEVSGKETKRITANTRGQTGASIADDLYVEPGARFIIGSADLGSETSIAIAVAPADPKGKIYAVGAEDVDLRACASAFRVSNRTLDEAFAATEKNELGLFKRITIFCDNRKDYIYRLSGLLQTYEPRLSVTGLGEGDTLGATITIDGDVSLITDYNKTISITEDGNKNYGLFFSFPRISSTTPQTANATIAFNTGWPEQSGYAPIQPIHIEMKYDIEGPDVPPGTQVSFVGPDGKSVFSDSLEQALQSPIPNIEFTLRGDVTTKNDLTVSATAVLNLNGHNLVAKNVEVSKDATMLISAGQNVTITGNRPADENDAGSFFYSLQNEGAIKSAGSVLVEGASLKNSGNFAVVGGQFMLDGNATVGNVELAAGASITLGQQFTAAGIAASITLPKSCYKDGYQVLSLASEKSITAKRSEPGKTAYANCFELVNPPSGKIWKIAEDGRLYGTPIPAELLLDRLTVAVKGELKLSNLLPWKYAGKVVWTIDDESVAKVGAKKEPKLTAKAVGETALRAVFPDGRERVISVRVVPKAEAVKSLSCKGALTVKLGGVKALSCKVKPKTASDQSLAYVSSDETIATVSQNGEVTAVGKGVCRVTVITSSGVRKVVKVTVK